MADDLAWQGHLSKIVDAILTGRLVPFLGADINLCDRPKTAAGTTTEWTDDAQFPPSNQELAMYLDSISEGVGPRYRQELSCPFVENQQLEHLPQDCPLRQGSTVLKIPVQNVSQYLATAEDGDVALYEALRNLFGKPYAPNAIHRFLASVPALLRGRTKAPAYPLTVTACFDSTLEQAFKDANEPFDLVGFIGDPQRGGFQHVTPEGDEHVITEPNTYTGLDLRKRPVILKLYRGYSSESFLITEDNYIDYLSHKDMTDLIPSSLLKILDENKLLFLGYNLSVWNQRVILRRLWQEKLNVRGKSWWAIQGQPDALDLRMWKRYEVKVLQRPDWNLEDYIAAINKGLQAIPTLAPVTQATAITAPKRNKIFFSYSHADGIWLERIKTAMGQLRRSGQCVWDDTQIQPGDLWMNEIQEALATTKVGILLVSQTFLNSDFILQQELPALLKAAREKELNIFPVILEPCDYFCSDLREIQAFPDPKRPLLPMDEAEWKGELQTMTQKVRELLNQP